MHSPENEDPFFIGNFQTGNIIRPPDFCDPIGPSFSKAKKYKTVIEGTEISFYAPKHKPIEKLDKARYPDAKYVYDYMSFRDTYREGLHLKDDWKNCILFSHTWAFNGPFLTGPLADIYAAFIVFTHKSQPDNTSLFHPRVFESTIADFLTNRYSKHKENGKHEYIAPVEWNLIEKLSVPAVRLKVISNDEVKLYEEVDYLFFPLDNLHLACFAFHYNRAVISAVTKEDLDKHIGSKNLYELVDNVINSVNISLSPAAKEQQQKALQGVEDTSVTKTFPPLKWDRDVETYNETQQKLASK